MSAHTGQQPLEEQIGEWRGYLRRRPALHPPDVDELEGHLRDQVAMLRQVGLSEDEAFLVAVKRIGSLDAVSREFAREHSERLWKQLVLAEGAGPAAAATSRLEAIILVVLAIAAALTIKIPALFGVQIDGPAQDVYAKNLSLFVFPYLACYFAWKRHLDIGGCVRLALPFLAAAIFVNMVPFVPRGQTEQLSALHLPIALWLVIGITYAGGRWSTSDARMDFVRFSGELFIYYVLMAFGGGVLTAFTIMMFHAIGIDAQWLAQAWILPCGAMGAVLVGSWLVEAKQSVIENMAPVLTRLFTPLFTVLLLVFAGTMFWTGNPIDVDRDVLIAFDLLLVVVVGLVLYSASARDAQAPPDFFDALQLLLVVSAVAVDAIALGAIAARISAFGFTAHRVAALGENLILLVNLAWTAWIYARVVRRRTPFSTLERWQTAYLPVYAVWAAVVVIVFPPLFGYR
ncbi:MAG TPA: permease prefix domain 1-containing protein [Vicinamibacterales bacterium]|jgi:hypothetical protein